MLGLVVTLAAFTLLVSPAFAQPAQSPPPQSAASPENPPADPSPSAPGSPPQEPASTEGRFLQPIPESLPDAIEVALDRSPDVRLARAKLEQAECELDQARMKVAQEVARLIGERRILGQGRATLRQQVNVGSAPVHELTECEGRLAQAEGELRYLLGLGPGMRGVRPASFGMGMELVPGQRPNISRDPTKSNIDNALSSPVSVDMGEAAQLGEILDFLGEYLSIVIVADVEVMGTKLTFKCEDIPLEQCLLAMTDHSPILCFVVREYGIFATTKERAKTIEAPTIPPIPYWREVPLTPQPLPRVADAPEQPEPPRTR